MAASMGVGVAIRGSTERRRVWQLRQLGAGHRPPALTNDAVRLASREWKHKYLANRVLLLSCLPVSCLPCLAIPLDTGSSFLHGSPQQPALHSTYLSLGRRGENLGGGLSNTSAQAIFRLVQPQPHRAHYHGQACRLTGAPQAGLQPCSARCCLPVRELGAPGVLSLDRPDQHIPYLQPSLFACHLRPLTSGFSVSRSLIFHQSQHPNLFLVLLPASVLHAWFHPTPLHEPP